MKLLVFTMYFSGGMIPFYLVVKGVGLYGSIWALILPVLVDTYNLIILRTAFAGVPDSLEESAKLDGANAWTILWRIMAPLVKPTVAVITLYYAVSHWNSWFNAMLFMREKTQYPLQLILRQILIQNDTADMTADQLANTAQASLAPITSSAKPSSTPPWWWPPCPSCASTPSSRNTSSRAS